MIIYNDFTCWKKRKNILSQESIDYSVCVCVGVEYWKHTVIRISINDCSFFFWGGFYDESEEFCKNKFFLMIRLSLIIIVCLNPIHWSSINWFLNSLIHTFTFVFFLNNLNSMKWNEMKWNQLIEIKYLYVWKMSVSQLFFVDLDSRKKNKCHTLKATWFMDSFFSLILNTLIRCWIYIYTSCFNIYNFFFSSLLA